jgi:FkbM family methyltransferase
MRSGRLLRALLFHRVLVGAEHRHMLAGELLTVVDIGANRGQFALAARRWAPRARVLAFEPLDGPAAIFRRVFSGDEKVILHQSAIGAASKIQTMHVSARDDSSSLLPISPVQTAMFPGTQEVTTVEVRMGTLNEFLSPDELLKPAMLKLDIQGFELDALEGCVTLLWHFDWIYCECSFIEFYTGQKLAGEVEAWLANKGFALSGIFNPVRDNKGQTVQADFLFRRIS